MPERFFVLEGPDAVGKTTAANSVVRSLRKRGLRTVYTHEPTRSRFGRLAVRRAVAGVDPTELLELFAADRAHHVEHLILPALKTGAVVIADRFKYSTFVYQGLTGLPAELLVNGSSGPSPQRTFLLTCPPAILEQRLVARGGAKVPSGPNHQLVTDCYLSLPKHYSNEPFTVVDAACSKREVASTILRAIEIDLFGA